MSLNDENARCVVIVNRFDLFGDSSSRGVGYVIGVFMHGLPL